MKAIEQIHSLCPDAICEYIELYPFEKYAEQPIAKELSKKGIYHTQGRYADCYDAGMFAYWYSIHRCAYMQYSHVEAYIKKMIRIYIVCALVVYDETRNICRENGLREIRLDSDVYRDY